MEETRRLWMLHREFLLRADILAREELFDLAAKMYEKAQDCLGKIVRIRQEAVSQETREG